MGGILRRLLGFILIGGVLLPIASCRMGQGTQGAPQDNRQDNQLTTVGNPVETPTPGPPTTANAIPTIVSLTGDVESPAALSSRAALAVSSSGGTGCREGRDACFTTSYALGIRGLALVQCRDGSSNPIDCLPDETGREVVLPPGVSLNPFVLWEGVENQFLYFEPRFTTAADLLGNIDGLATRPITVAGVYSAFQFKIDFVLMELPPGKTPFEDTVVFLCLNENGCHALGYPSLPPFPPGSNTQKGDFLFLRLSDSSWYFFDKERDQLVPVTTRPAQLLRQTPPPLPVDSTGAAIYNASFGSIPSIVVDQARLDAGQTLRLKVVFSVRNALSYQDPDNDGRIGLTEFETIEFGKPLIVNFEAVFE